MKTQFTSRIVKLTFAFMFILLASSCSEDNDAMEAAALAKEINNEIAAKGAKIAATVASTLVISLGDCTTDCIDENSGAEFANTHSGTVQWGGRYGTDNSKTFSVNVWNTLTTIEYQFICDQLGGSNLQYYDESLAIPTWVSAGQFTITNAGVITVSRTLPEGWQACDVITEQWRQTGSGTDIDLGNVSYNLIGECAQGCEESFSYIDNGNNNFTFTYIPAEDMEGAELVFTFAQGTTVSGLTDWDANGQTRKMIMNLVACETYTWTVTFSAKCSGNSPESNVFTDFKVNDLSRKGNINKIEIPCTDD